MARHTSRATLAAIPVAILLGTACRWAESPEARRAHSEKEFLERQIDSLQVVVGKAERGELVTLDQIAIGVDERVAGTLIQASLPRDVAFKGLAVRIESAQPLFRGNQAGLLLRGRVNSESAPGLHASVELGGTLDDFRLVAGRLTARVKVIHVALLGSSVGKLGGPRVEGLIRDNLRAIEGVIPAIEIPVGIEESVGMENERLGPVTVRPGRLPLRITVAQVIPVNERLWILLDAVVGPWQRTAPAAAP